MAILLKWHPGPAAGFTHTRLHTPLHTPPTHTHTPPPCKSERQLTWPSTTMIEHNWIMCAHGLASATSKECEPSMLRESLMSKWKGCCPLKRSPDFSHVFSGLQSCFLGGPAENQAPKDSRGLYSVELFFFLGSGVMSKCYFSLFFHSWFHLFCLPLMRHQRPTRHSCDFVSCELFVLELLVFC